MRYFLKYLNQKELILPRLSGVIKGGELLPPFTPVLPPFRVILPPFSPFYPRLA
jgi:hypothetical protein